MRPKGTAAELESRRRRGVALLNAGHGVREVARMVGAWPGSVSKWQSAYRKRGRVGLRAKAHLGPKPRLTAAQRKRLGILLLKGAPAFGYPTELWTLDRVAEVIRKRFKVRYHPDHVWRILHNMRWSCQKPERRARERNEAAIARWRRDDWPRLKKRPEGSVGRSFS